MSSQISCNSIIFYFESLLFCSLSPFIKVALGIGQHKAIKLLLDTNLSEPTGDIMISDLCEKLEDKSIMQEHLLEKIKRDFNTLTEVVRGMGVQRLPSGIDAEGAN